MSACEDDENCHAQLATPQRPVYPVAIVPSLSPAPAKLGNTPCFLNAANGKTVLVGRDSVGAMATDNVLSGWDPAWRSRSLNFRASGVAGLRAVTHTE